MAGFTTHHLPAPDQPGRKEGLPKFSSNANPDPRPQMREPQLGRDPGSMGQVAGPGELRGRQDHLRGSGPPCIRRSVGLWNITPSSHGPALPTARGGENLPASHCPSSSFHIDHGFPSTMTSPGCLNGNGEERCPFALQAVGALHSGPSRDAFGLQLPAAGSVLFPGPSPFPGREKLTLLHGEHQDAVQPLLGRALQALLSHRLKSPQSRRAPLALRTARASRSWANRRPSCRSLVPSPRFLSLDAKQGGLTMPNSESTQGTV